MTDAADVAEWIERERVAENTECTCTERGPKGVRHAGCKVAVKISRQRREQHRRWAARNRKKRDAARARREWWTPERRRAKSEQMKPIMKRIWGEWRAGTRPISTRQVLLLRERGMWPDWAPQAPTSAPALVPPSPAASRFTESSPRPNRGDYPSTDAFLADFTEWVRVRQAAGLTM